MDPRVRSTQPVIKPIKGRVQTEKNVVQPEENFEVLGTFLGTGQREDFGKNELCHMIPLEVSYNVIPFLWF